MPQLVSTGTITVTDVNDGLNARLNNDSASVVTLSDGTGGDYSQCSSTISVYLGTADDSSNWTYTATPSTGVSGALVGQTYTVSNMTADAGYVDLKASRVGYPDLVCRFTVTKAKQGYLGPSVWLLPSAAGFTFVDGVATPSNQSISFTVVRRNTTDPVVFYATGNAGLVTNNLQLSLQNYMLGIPGTGAGDVAYLDIAAFGANDQVTVTAAVGDFTTSYTVARINTTTAEAGATRNVARGDWANGVTYAKGDMVLYGGYGWLCLVPHVSSGGITPPTYPTTSNTQWTLTTYKGVDAKALSLTASSYVFQVAKNGTVSPSSIALSPIGQNTVGSPSFAVTSGTATLTGTGNSRTLTAANLTTDQATIQVTWDGLTDTVTVTKVREGTDAISVVLGNEAHVLPADPTGIVTTYAGSGTTIQVYEGTTALTASSSGTVSAFRVGTITQSPASTITVGGVSYAGTTATVAAHSAMAAGTDSVVLTIPITAYRADGSTVSITKVQTVSKGKQGSAGVSYLLNQNQSVSADETGAVASFVGIDTQFKNFEGVNDTTNNWNYYVSAIGSGIAYRDSDDGADRTGTGYAVGGLGGENLLANSTNINLFTPTGSSTLVTSGTLSPNGVDYASIWTRVTTASSYFGSSITKAASALAYTGSMWVNSNTGRYFALRLQGSYPARADVVFDLQTGVISSAAAVTSSFAGASATITDYTGGWYRVTLTATSDTATSIGIYGSFNSNGVAIDSTDSSSSSSGYVWGPQLERTTAATEYTPTSGGARSGVRGYLKVASLSADSSWIDITASRVGYASRTLRYTLTKNRAGVTGTRGTITTSRAISGSVWSDTEANTAITNAGGGSPLQGDIVTLYNTGAQFSQTRIRSSGGTWTVLTAIFGGDVIVDRTLGANKIVSASITGGEIAAGTISSANISSNTITAANLSVTDFQNLAYNGDLLLTDGLTVTTRLTVLDSPANAYNSKRYVISVAANATTNYNTLSPGAYFAATSGEKFWLSWYGRAPTALTGFVQVYIRWEDTAGAQVATSSVGTLTTQTSWTQFANEVTVPATACRGIVWITQANTANTAYIGQVQLFRRNAGTLLVDGAISTNQLAANSITVEKLRVGLRNVATQGITFTPDKDNNILSWSGGNLLWVDDTGATVTQIIQGGSTTWTSGYKYISFLKLASVVPSPGVTFDVQSTPTNYYNEDSYIPIAIYEGGATYTVNVGSVVIDGSKIVANSIYGDRIIANSLDGGAVTAGTLTADRIQTSSISAKQLAVADLQNLVFNGDFQYSAGLPTTGRVAVATDPANAFGNKSLVLVGSPNATNSTVFYNSDADFSANPGEKFYFEWWGKVSATLTGTCYPRVRWLDSTGAAITTSNVGTLSNQTTYTQFSGEVTAPTGTVKGRIDFPCTNTAGTAYIGQIRLNRKNATSLIVDGTITGNLIAADTITTEKLRVGLRNAAMTGVIFTPNKATNTLNWNSGSITYIDETGATVTQPTAAGSAVYSGTTRYISFLKPAVVSGTPQALDVQSTATNYMDSSSYIPVAIYQGGATYSVKVGSTVIDGSTIVTGTVNADRIESNTITAGQIAAGAISATELAANSISASKMLLQDANMVLDPSLTDVDDGTTPNAGKYWQLNTGTVQTGTTNSNAMNVPVAFACPTGNGTTSQTFCEIQTKGSGSRMIVEPGGVYRVYGLVRVTTGYTGRVRLLVRWYDKDNALISSSTVTTDVSTGSPVSRDWRTTAATAAANYQYEGQATAPSNAYYARFSFYFEWSTTLNNAGYALAAMPKMVRANTAYMIVDGAIQTNHMTANTIDGDRITTNSLDGGKITAATIYGDRIVSNSITADQLTVTDTTNYLINSDLRSWDAQLAAATAAGTAAPTVPSGWNRVTASGGSLVAVATGANWPSKYALRLYRATSNTTECSIVNGKTSFDDTTMADGIACNAGDEFYFEAIVWTTGTTTYLDIDMILRTSSTTTVNLTPFAKTSTSVSGNYLVAAPGAAWTKVTGYFKYSGTSNGKAYLRFNHRTTSTQNTNIYVAKPRLLKKANGELVVDGSITATHINVSQLDAISATVGLLRTASSGARTEIASNLISVYDSSNVLRVRLGVW